MYVCGLLLRSHIAKFGITRRFVGFCGTSSNCRSLFAQAKYFPVFPLRKNRTMASEIRKVVLPADVVLVPDEFPGFAVQSFMIPDYYKDDLECVLVPNGALKNRTEKLAADLFSSYPPGEPILLICVLKSALGFFNALLASLQNLNHCASTSISPARRHDIDRIKNSQFGQENADRTPEKNSEMASSHPLLLEFIRVRSYENDHSTGQVEIDGISDMKASVAGMNVVIVEDMIDTGTTMKFVLEAFKKFSPKSLKVATLVRKRCSGGTGFIPDFLGFDIPDRFIVGFSIDYNQHFRDLEHLCVVNENGKEKYASKRKSP